MKKPDPEEKYTEKSLASNYLKYGECQEDPGMSDAGFRFHKNESEISEHESKEPSDQSQPATIPGKSLLGLNRPLGISLLGDTLANLNRPLGAGLLGDTLANLNPSAWRRPAWRYTGPPEPSACAPACSAIHWPI